MLQQLGLSVSPWALIALAVSISFLFLTISYYNEAKLIRKLGGRAPVLRSYLPFGVDNLYLTIKYISAFRDYEWWERNFKLTSSRTIEANFGGMRLLLTDEPANIKALLAAQFSDYGKGPRFHYEWKDFLGDGIFTTDQELWRDSRALIRPQFIKDRVSDLETFDHHVEEMLTHFKPGQPIDVEDLFFRMTLDIATKFLLGESVGSLRNPKTRFATAFNDVQRIQNYASRMGPLFYPLLPKWKFNKGIRTIDSFVLPFIERTLALSPKELEDSVKSSKSYTFLHAVAGYTRDPKMIRDQLVSILLAGRDTTAGALSWALLELGRNPQVVRTLREEIISTVGLSESPTYADLKNMRYLNSILSETLRLYPSVPFNIRTALTDTSLPTGGGPDRNQPIGIPKGTGIAYSVLNMQRRPWHYPSDGPAADVWSPERWQTWQPVPWTYVPFNGGPRICVGQQFALAEMGFTLVKIFQRFESVQWIGKEEDVRMRCEIVMRPSEKVELVFRESESEKID